jgi:hypothetical protein
VFSGCCLERLGEVVHRLDDVDLDHRSLLGNLALEFFEAELHVGYRDGCCVEVIAVAQLFAEDLSALLQSRGQLSHHLGVLLAEGGKHGHRRESPFVEGLDRRQLVPKVIFKGAC